MNAECKMQNAELTGGLSARFFCLQGTRPSPHKWLKLHSVFLDTIVPKNKQQQPTITVAVVIFYKNLFYRLFFQE